MSWLKNENNILRNTKRTEEELVKLNEMVGELVALQEEQNRLLRKLTQ
ncbi:hypothetical protein ACTXK0_14230 [Corynebacterium variabile]